MTRDENEAPLVAGAPTSCSRCAAPLCLRKQVVNLAVGYSDKMLCLVCLGRENAEDPREVLAGLKGYVQGRDCFRKEWKRYESLEYCPDRGGCFPGVCFDG